MGPSGSNGPSPPPPSRPAVASVRSGIARPGETPTAAIGSVTVRPGGLTAGSPPAGPAGWSAAPVSPGTRSTELAVAGTSTREASPTPPAGSGGPAAPGNPAPPGHLDSPGNAPGRAAKNSPASRFNVASSGSQPGSSGAPGIGGAVTSSAVGRGVVMEPVDRDVVEHGQRVVGQHRQRAVQRHQVRRNGAAVDAHEAHRESRALFAGQPRLVQPDDPLPRGAGAQQQHLRLAVDQRHLVARD